MAKAKGKKKTEVLDYGAQVRSLREQGPGRLYLLWGREDYLREQYLLELKKLCLPGGEDDFSYHRFDGAELDFQALADAVDAVPFLTERTLIEVRGFDTNKCREEEAQALVRVIGDLPDYCTLVFLMSTDFEPDGRLKTTKAFKKCGELIQFTAQGESALVRWVGKRFAAHKKHISPEDARQLIFFTGGLMNSMIPEIDKIAAYVSSDTVTRADILAVAHRLPEAVAYELTDRLADQTMTAPCAFSRTSSPTRRTHRSSCSPSSASRCAGFMPRGSRGTRALARAICARCSACRMTSLRKISCARPGNSPAASSRRRCACARRRTLP